MKLLKITQCSDSLMWYNKHIGSLVAYINEEEDIYWSREPGGYKNIILKRDAEVVEVEDGKQV